MLFIAFLIWQLLSSARLVPHATRDDTWVHFLFSVIVSQVLYLAIKEFGQIKDEHGHHSEFTRFGTVLLVLLFGMAIGCFWEMTEFSIDHIVGAHLQLGNVDTVTDLMADSTGSLVGGLILAYKSPRKSD